MDEPKDQNEQKISVQDLLNAFSSSLPPEDLMYTQLTSEISIGLFRIRNTIGMSVEEFSEQIGIPEETIKEWELGKHNFTIREISQAFSKLGLDLEFNIKQKEEKTDE